MAVQQRQLVDSWPAMNHPEAWCAMQAVRVGHGECMAAIHGSAHTNCAPPVSSPAGCM